MNAFDDLEAQIAALQCADYHSHNEDDFSDNGEDPLEEFMSRPTPAPPALATQKMADSTKRDEIIIDLTSEDETPMQMDAPKPPKPPA